MASRQCHHCKELVEDWSTHNCWKTTEAALTGDLSDDLQEAYARLRETAAAHGEQRIYASHHCIMFSRKACYLFVRPKRNALEVCIFLGRTLKVPQVRRTAAASRTKVAHILHVRHRDEVEAPLTDWLAEAYAVSDSLSAGPPSKRPAARPASKRRTAKKAKKTLRRKRAK
jgi:hypothetical protein